MRLSGRHCTPACATTERQAFVSCMHPAPGSMGADDQAADLASAQVEQRARDSSSCASSSSDVQNARPLERRRVVPADAGFSFSFSSSVGRVHVRLCRARGRLVGRRVEDRQVEQLHVVAGREPSEWWPPEPELLAATRREHLCVKQAINNCYIRVRLHALVYFS